MKQWIAALCMTLLLVSFAKAEGAPKVQYFCQNICESCTPEADFLDEYERLTGKTLSASQLEGHNVFHSTGWQALEDAARSLTISMDAVKLPMAVIDGTVYMGTSAL